jgi:PAS domain S-box-containing protein
MAAGKRQDVNRAAEPMENEAIKVLVVENNPVLLKAVTTLLIREGCMVKPAETGLAALEILQDYEPDIVFTDLIMPLVSGEQLCRILRNTKKHENIFIVVLSAIILEDRERILREIACDLCIAKGDLQELRQHLRDALATYKARKAIQDHPGGMNTRIPAGLKPSEVTSELLSEKKHLAQIFANLDEGILELSGNGKIVAANNAAIRIFSLPEEQLIGRPLTQVIDWGPFRQDLEQWTDGQLVHQGMQAFKIYEDQPLTLQQRIITGSFHAIAESSSVFGLCIFHDISRQYLAERHSQEMDNAIKLIKKMDAMSCMAGGVAHDLNNLLTVICGNLDILNTYRENIDDRQRDKLIEQARRAALATVDLTRQISCFSNFGIVSRKSVGIDQLVRSAVNHFSEEEPGNYSIVASTGTDCQVSVDPEEISRAIANVLKNAVEASSCGPIEVSIGSADFDRPQLLSGQYVPAGSYAKIDIRDFGRGIDREQLFRIFDPYYSTKERGASKGMGLGLTVVYATLRNHGGYVVVASELEKGTTVSLFLPIQQDGQETAGPGEASARFALLVEPDNQMREIGRIMLEHLGFTVTVAGRREEALTALRQLVADPAQPLPLVILDLSDANGESAAETCRLLREIVPKLKVVAMSGSSLDPVMQDCRKYGFNHALTKPYTMDSLRHITGMVLNI